MQSIFRLPWCSDQVMPKLQDTMSFDPLRASTMAEMAGLTKLKRKHATTSDASQPRTQVSKKARLEHSWPQQIVASPKPVQLSTVPVAPAKRQAAVHVSIPPVAYTTPSVITSLPQQVIPEMSHVPTGIQHSKPAQVACPMADPSKLTQVIENEFNMQILLKHNELRLIEQELAKCQVALEQLRRCELRPYPGSDRLSLAVTDGTGPAISPQPGMTQPTHAAPFGVVDGPYSRHYAQWLLHDHQFDSVPISYASSTDCGDASARSTRTGSTVRKSSSKSIALPSYRDAHASISHAPAPAPRDKSAPLVLRRSTDNQLVKLVCNTCNRGNFSSIQGFLNHCRIAHKVDYKSHDAAALDCGCELTEQEAANLPADAATTPAAKPAPAAKVVLHAAIPVKGQVHPLNAPGELPALSKVKTPSSKAKAIKSKIETSHLQSNSPFRGTKLAPHLSAHFSKFKLSGDLHEAVAAARQRVDLSSTEDELSLSEVSTPVSPMDLTRPEMAGFLARPLSSKGYREPLQRTRPSPLVPVVRHASPDYLNDTPMLTPNLSPNGTDSNPGMVSDHEDDDHASGSEDEAPQTASLAHSLPVRRTCADSMDIDVIEDDDVNDHGVVIRRNSMLAYDDGPGTTNSSPSRPALVKKPSK